MGHVFPKLPLPLGIQAPTKYMVTWAYPTPQSKGHLNWFGCFCRARACVQQTDRPRYIDSNRLHLTLCTAMRRKNQQNSYLPKTKEEYCKIFIQLLKITRSSAIAEGPRDASCQLKSCQLPCNSAETTYTTSPDQIDGMKLEI